MDKENKKKSHIWIKTAAAAVFWLAVWQIAVMRMDNRILAASPFETVKTLWKLLQTAVFWKTVASSFAKIASGFFIAVLAGVFCAAAASAFGPVRVLLDPLFRLIKVVPVASFIILALFWLSTSKNLSVLISFLMVLPVIYTNVSQGIASTERELLEMADVFRISFGKRLRYIYLPAVLPYFVSACSVGLGFCFKSGIAAEIIGLPQNSIGRQLYEAKLYLMTEELFAWTAVIVIVSVVFEKLVMLLVRTLAKALTGTLQKTGDTKQEENFIEQSEAADLQESLAAAFREAQEVLTGLVEALPVSKEPEGYGLFDVTKRFDDKTVLERFTLKICPGETVALMGASGAGKSTAGKLLLGILEAEEGTVKRPKRMGAVFQEDRLCKEFDAVTNIAMVTGDRRQAEEALAAAGLSGIKGRPSEALSGGMKRRVAILRALLSDAEVLVLDEPFTGLDAAVKQKVLRCVKEKLKGRNALFITHNEEEAAFLADRTVSLEQCMGGKG
ncbi:MAG: ATP-binding cassette domain-containing protein [Lachnospiraceae bacterium]|nr:ATP-binding cassette domain-containing protein [Lachnospiraceae bacterium]